VPESYVHRIGRTARAGAGGQAISLVGDDERGLLRDIQKVTRQTIPAFDRRNDSYLAQAQAAQAHLNIPTPGDDHGSGGRGKPQGQRGAQGPRDAHRPEGRRHSAPARRPSHADGGYDPLKTAEAPTAKRPNRRRRRPGGGGGAGQQHQGAAG
jgi:ATP-dependent RNA helicase RhlE